MKINFYLQYKGGSEDQIFMIVSFKIEGKSEEIKYLTDERIPHEIDKSKGKNKHWNFREQRARGGNYNSLNASLDSLQAKVTLIHSDLKITGKLTKEDFKNAILKAEGKEHRIKKTGPKEPEFINYWGEYYELSKTRISKITKRQLSQRTLDMIAQAGRDLLKFQTNYNYQLTPYNMDSKFYEKLRQFYIGKGEKDLKNSVNSFSQFAKHVKHFCKWLSKRVKDMPMDWMEFERYEAYDEDDIKPLYPEEVLKLWNLDLTKIPGLENSYYIFMNLISYGLRISDHNFYQFSDYKRFSRIVFGQVIEGDVLTFKNVKARSSCNVPIVDNEIFRPGFMRNVFKSKGEIPRIDGEQLNKDLKVIGEAAGIDRFRLMSKTGRKTFATLWLQMGMEIHEAMKMGGWKSERAFKAYVGIDRTDLIIKTTQIKDNNEKNNYLKVS